MVDLANPALTSEVEPACAPPASGVRACVWRYPGEKLAAMPEINDPVVREKLRALGYLRCDKGARLLALPGARAMFRTTAPLDDWSVTGCDFDLNGVAVAAWETSGDTQGGARWTFRDNTVHGMSSAPGEPLSSVRLDCTLASGPCLIANNTIVGSESAARGDTCLTVTAGGFVGFNTQVLGNYLQGCGKDCLAVRRPGGITASDNVFVRCLDNAVDNSSLNSVWTGNQLATAGKDAGALMSIHDTIGNQVIVGNQFAVNPRSSAPAVHAIAMPDARLAGLYVDGNYAAQGVWFDAKGKCGGGTCGGETCDGDGGCAGCGGGCTAYGVFDHDHVANLIVTGEIRIESATNVVVQGNIVIGTAGEGTASQIRFSNPRPNAPSGGIVVADNQLAKRAGASGGLACIDFDDEGGGGFAGVTITGNSCGQDPAIASGGARSHGIRLTRPPQVWRSVLIADNNLANTADALVGFTTPQVRRATRLSGNLGLGAGDAQPVVESFHSAAPGLSSFAVVAPSAAADLAVTRAVRGSAAAVGCALVDAAPGAAVPVAVAGIADCLASGVAAAIARGDALALSAEPGHLAKAAPDERIFGYAMEASDQAGPLRILIQPGASGRSAAPVVHVARTHSDTVRAENATPQPEASLSLPLEQGKSYALDGTLRVRAADARTGLAAAVGLPPGGALGVVLRAEPAGASSSALLTRADGASALIPLAVGDNVVTVSGTVTTAASGGALELRWAQSERGPAPLVLQAGSWLRTMELP